MLKSLAFACLLGAISLLIFHVVVKTAGTSKMPEEERGYGCAAAILSFGIRLIFIIVFIALMREADYL